MIARTLPFHYRSPRLRVEILRVPRKQPVAPIQILRRVLVFSILCLMRRLENLGRRGFRPRIVPIHIVYENR